MFNTIFPKIHKEGYKFLAISILVTFIVLFFSKFFKVLEDIPREYSPGILCDRAAVEIPKYKCHLYSMPPQFQTFQSEHWIGRAMSTIEMVNVR